MQKLNVAGLKIGDMIAAPFNGSGWYRGEIKDIVCKDDWISDNNNNNKNDRNETSAERIDIYYVDFGDSAYVEKSAIRRLLKDFNELPCQAVRCSLDNIEPATDNKDDWSEDAINFFEDITYSCQWKELKAKLDYFKETRGNQLIPSIKLYDLVDVSKLTHACNVV
jgi:hypothetical protein